MRGMQYLVRRIEEKDHDWVVDLLIKRSGATRIVSRGRVHLADELPGFIAICRKKPVGLATYHVENQECEIVTLDSMEEGVGIGSALIEAVKGVASAAQCKRLWLITTNDNTAALRFYQKKGFVLVGVHRNALEQSRRLKPEIPFIGIDGIPLRDEIELEIIL